MNILDDMGVSKLISKSFWKSELLSVQMYVSVCVSLNVKTTALKEQKWFLRILALSVFS